MRGRSIRSVAHHEGKRRKKALLPVGERLARPFNGGERRFVEVAGALFYRLVVIALERHGAVGSIPDDDIHDTAWIGAIADKIPQEGEALRTMFTGVPQASRQRLGVGVDVGQQRNAQRTCSGGPLLCNDISREQPRCAVELHLRALPRFRNARLTVDLPVVVIKFVQVTRDFTDVTFAPDNPGSGLPASDLRLQARPVSHQLLVPPMDFCGVASDAIRRVQKLAPWLAGLRNRLRRYWSASQQARHDHRHHPIIDQSNHSRSVVSPGAFRYVSRTSAQHVAAGRLPAWCHFGRQDSRRLDRSQGPLQCQAKIRQTASPGRA